MKVLEPLRRDAASFPRVKFANAFLSINRPRPHDAGVGTGYALGYLHHAIHSIVFGTKHHTCHQARRSCCGILRITKLRRIPEIMLSLSYVES